MLSAACSHRLVSLLSQALGRCTEEETQLEHQLRQCHVLLGSWKTAACESPEQEDTTSGCQESEPSVDELEDVELLNRALEKALRVRGSSRSETPVVRAPPNTQKAPSAPPTKPPKSTCRISKPGRKTATYILNPPYRTNPERKRVRGSGRPASNPVVARSDTPGCLPAEKGSRSCAGQPEARGDSGTAESMLGKSVSHSAKETPVVETKGDRGEPNFTLKDKGETLKLPLAYRREHKRNSRLWEKFYEIQHPASQPPCIQKLQATFHPTCSGHSLSELEEGVSRMERALVSLRQSTDTAKQWRGTGPQHWQNYRSLLTFEALEEETSQKLSALHQLRQSAEQYLRGAEGSRALGADQRGCPTPFHRAPTLLIYSSSQELAQLTRCRLRVLELRQKIYLQKAQYHKIGVKQMWCLYLKRECDGKG
ncbi:tubulin epsilon and delta complex protein 2 isoform X2 [Ascaphus truei]|uniref:tubulin epsilon and delta complex protein 2 isoform X2 n=1 Tax=Ascaphus truei TaxID=8439 RepID=UPI003F59F92F